MLAHRLRQWHSSKTELAKHLIFAGSHRQRNALTQCWFNVGTVSLMMAQHLNNTGSAQGRRRQRHQRDGTPVKKQ